MSMSNAANIGIEADPRLDKGTYPDPVEPYHMDLNGPVSFEQYLEFAARQRQIEDSEVISQADSGNSAEKGADPGAKTQLSPHDQEMVNARRALRTASWWATFYLITTDILGPFNAPYAFSTVGYVPGVLLYFFMGIAACYAGLLLWYLFLKLDSNVFPIRTYGDLTERIFGRTFKHLVTILQSLQLIVNVGTICLSNAQSLTQMDKNRLCFVVAILIWALFGMFIGQIRTLKAYGWLANSAVWFNLLIIFTSMGFIAHSPPNYTAAQASYGSAASGPIVHSTFVGGPLYTRVNGVMNMVFAYGGAMIFPELLAEMRRPWDFWKGMVCAQLLIFSAYMMYGAYVYSFQGQYTLPLAFQGVSKYSWQTVGNVFALITGIIAAGLYGNIGIKVAYYNIVEGWFNGPPLLSRSGRFIWSGMVVVYWALAFVVGAAIPQVQTISGLVAAVCIMQFSYTFPPLFVVGFLVKRDGMFGGGLKMNLFKFANLIMFLGAAALACLGMYGSGMSIKQAFTAGAATSFGCTPPV